MPSDRRPPLGRHSASRRRSLLVPVLAAVLAATIAAPALPGTARAWTHATDGYSTHDWFIDQAVAVLNGRANDWFDAEVARLASDDPDTIPALADGISHVYRESGARGGAVQRISEHYSAALAQYRAGASARAGGSDGAARTAFRAASHEIGLLSHYLTDIMQPYHSAAAGTGKDSIHHDYEMLVDPLTRRASDMSSWHTSSRSVSKIGNIRSVAVAAAAYSRSKFSALHAEMTASRSRLTTRAKEITGALARRAAQDLANIIWSVSQGAGKSPDVASLRTKVKWVGVAANEPYQGLYIWAKDSAGRPIEGLEVVISWPLADGGTTTVKRWTDPNGYIKYSRAVGGGPLLVRRTINLKTTATLPDATRTASTWFQATPRLASGTAGLKTVIRDATLKPGQQALVTTLARDTAGRPVPGLPVTWTWKYGSKTIVTKGITGADGKARTSRTVYSTTTTKTITVTAHVQAASSNRYASTSFRRI